MILILFTAINVIIFQPRAFTNTRVFVSEAFIFISTSAKGVVKLE